MKDNVLIGVLLGVAFSTPVFAWLFYLWYRSHLTRMHQEGQIFERRSRDRLQANYEPANGAPNYTIGPYFTTRGWVRPKTRGLSHPLRPPQYVHPRQPMYTGVPHPDHHFQGPSRANIHSAQTANQQRNPLSKRQQRKQRALQNKQRQKEQQQSQDEQGSKKNRNNQRKQKKKNQGQNKQKSPTAQSPKAQSPKSQGEHGEQHYQWGNTEGQNDRRSNHDGGTGWANDRSAWGNQHNTDQNDNDINNCGGSNLNNDQGGQRNSQPCSPRRNSRGSQENHGWDQDNNISRERSPQWDNEHQDEHRNSNHHDERYSTRPASPDRASINEGESRWGGNDHGAQQNSHLQSHYSNEAHHNRNDGWGDNDIKSHYKESKSNRYTSPERISRGRSSPNRDWGHNDDGRRNHSRNRSDPWSHAEEHRGGGNESWRQDGNGDKKKGKKEKKKKERWQIELEENAKRGRSRSPSRGGSERGWDMRSRASGWKETQKW